MRNFAPAALAIAQDICKEDHFRIIIEKHCANQKTEIKTLQNGLRCWEIYEGM